MPLQYPGAAKRSTFIGLTSVYLKVPLLNTVALPNRTSTP